jgi:hypothetical protein
MATAFEIVGTLALDRKVAVAVERFSYDLQPALDELGRIDDPAQRAAKVETVFQSPAYMTVWGVKSFDRTGYPVNTPSRPVFEEIIRWAARANIPLIALDVTLAERKQGLGEDLAYRNELWKKKIDRFLADHRRENYQIVVIGGIDHMTNEPDTFPTKMKSRRASKVISIGQRDAMYRYHSSAKVRELAGSFNISELIVRSPEFALVSIKGAPTFARPPDYWIAVHAATLPGLD